MYMLFVNKHLECKISVDGHDNAAGRASFLFYESD